MIIDGRYHNLNGNVILLQRSTRNLLACAWYIFVKIVTFGKWPKTSEWTWIDTDFINLGNDKYKAMERLNDIVDEVEKLTKFIVGQDAMLLDIKKEIEASSDETKGYGKRVKFDISQFKYRTLDIKEPEHRWKRLFKSQGVESIGGLMNDRQTPKANVDLAFTDKRSNEKFGFALNQIAKKDGADDLVPVDVSENENKGNKQQKKGGGGGGGPAPFDPNNPKKRKDLGETNQSFTQRKSLLDTGMTVPLDWDLKTT